MEQEAHNEKQIKELQDQVKHLKTKNEILKKDSKQQKNAIDSLEK